MKPLLSEYIHYYREDRTHLDREGCTTGTIALRIIRTNLASRKRRGSSILIYSSSILIYTGIPLGVPREGFLALAGEGIIWELRYFHCAYNLAEAQPAHGAGASLKARASPSYA